MNQKKKISAFIIAIAIASTMAACNSAAPSSSSAASSSDASSAPASSSEVSSVPASSSDASSAPASSSDASSAAAGDIAPLTDEEAAYVENVTALMENMQNMQNLQTEAQQASDPAAVAAVMDKAKKPFQDFAALEAPGRFVPAQEKFKSGCESIVAYFDMTVEMSGLKPEELTAEKQQEYVQKMTELLTTAQTDLVAGATLAEEVSPAE